MIKNSLNIETCINSVELTTLKLLRGGFGRSGMSKKLISCLIRNVSYDSKIFYNFEHREFTSLVKVLKTKSKSEKHQYVKKSVVQKTKLNFDPQSLPLVKINAINI